MSEINDLTPQQPATEAPLSAKDIGLYLAAKGAEQPCQACGSSDWRLHDEAQDECGTAIALFKLDNPGRQSIKPTVTIICRQCAAVRQFVRAAVASWVWEYRRG